MKKNVILLVIMLMGLMTILSAQNVYVTASGHKYHKKDCPSIKNTKAATMEINKARRAGYSACDQCYTKKKAGASVSGTAGEVKKAAEAKYKEVKKQVDQGVGDLKKSVQKEDKKKKVNTKK